MRFFITFLLCLGTCLQNVLGQINTAQTENDTTIYTVMQQQPIFVGGQEAMTKWLRKNLKIGDLKVVCKSSVLDKIFFLFVIEKDGNLSNKSIKMRLQTTSDECRKAVEKQLLAMLDSMPAWEAGRQDGKPVRVRYSIPTYYCYMVWED